MASAWPRLNQLVTSQIWDATTGGRVLLYTRHRALTWSPDGARIASSAARAQTWVAC